MKFCKNLQRVVDISDPEWAPYWTNYKMLKKLIKDLEPRRGQESIGKSAGEVAFFKLLHSEFKKASRFFYRATKEFEIREERVIEGVNVITRQPDSPSSSSSSAVVGSEKWVLAAKSIHKLHKDLLLLETFAIMTYCSFSKILKKHDKVTGYETKSAFMANVVNKANFANYPKVLAMIERCERFYEEVSAKIIIRRREEEGDGDGDEGQSNLSLLSETALATQDETIESMRTALQSKFPYFQGGDRVVNQIPV